MTTYSIAEVAASQLRVRHLVHDQKKHGRRKGNPFTAGYASVEALSTDLASLVPGAEVKGLVKNDPSVRNFGENTVAYFDPVDKNIHLGPDLTRTLEAFVKREPGSRITSLEATSVTTLLHETYHSSSPLMRNISVMGGRATGPGWQFMEEGLSERKARTHANALLKGAGSNIDVNNLGRGYSDLKAGMDWYGGKFGEKALEEIWKADTHKARAALANKTLTPWMESTLKKRLPPDEAKRALNELSIHESRVWTLWGSGGAAIIDKGTVPEIRTWFDSVLGRNIQREGYN